MWCGDFLKLTSHKRTHAHTHTHTHTNTKPSRTHIYSCHIFFMAGNHSKFMFCTLYSMLRYSLWKGISTKFIILIYRGTPHFTKTHLQICCHNKAHQFVTISHIKNFNYCFEFKNFTLWTVFKEWISFPNWGISAFIFSTRVGNGLCH
jgi:hypothetical protein